MSLWASKIRYAPNYDLARATDGGTIYWSEDSGKRSVQLSPGIEQYKDGLQVRAFIRRINRALSLNDVKLVNNELAKEVNGFFPTPLQEIVCEIVD